MILRLCFCVVCCQTLSSVTAFVCFRVVVFFLRLRVCLLMCLCVCVCCVCVFVFFVVKIVWCKRCLVSKVSGVKIVCCKSCLVSQVSSVEAVKGAWCKSVLL